MDRPLSLWRTLIYTMVLYTFNPQHWHFFFFLNLIYSISSESYIVWVCILFHMSQVISTDSPISDRLDWLTIKLRTSHLKYLSLNCMILGCEGSDEFNKCNSKLVKPNPKIYPNFIDFAVLNAVVCTVCTISHSYICHFSHWC